MDWTLCPIDTLKNSGSIAIQTEEKCLTYGEFNALIERSCLDLPPKKPIAFLAKRSIETLALFFALWRQKRLALPLNPRLPEHAIQSALKATDAVLIDPLSASTFACDSTLDLSLPATLLFTSGTTSSPKIACHSLGNHFHSAKGAISLLDLKAGDRYLLDLPLHHVGGLAAVLRTFLAGATLLLGPQSTEPTHLSLVPTQLLRMLRSKSLPKKAKCLLIGGAALPPFLLNEAQKNGLPIYRSYGMTETSSMAALQKPNEHATQLLPGAELKIHEGEIYVRGPMLFQGYYRSDGSLTLPLENGWFATRDLGRFTKDNTLEWLGRKDRQFTSGGENIQPEEIESLLLSFPGVIEAYIKPVVDEEFGCRIKALLYCEEKISLNEMEEKLRTHLPGYKIPKEWQLLSNPLKGG